MDARNQEATPIEIAALLMEAVCTPAEQEQDALGQLAAHLGVELPVIQAELMYLRAFAVDFATAMALSESPEKEAIEANYYHHWDRIAQEAGAEVLDDLRQRLDFYTGVVNDSAASTNLLKDQIGQAFAWYCQVGESNPDLAVLGGAMFAAFFDEVVDLFDRVDIVLYEGNGGLANRPGEEL